MARQRSSTFGPYLRAGRLAKFRVRGCRRLVLGAGLGNERLVRVVCIGGGPAGLYFAILMKKAWPAAEVTVVERNRADDTFGFGVVFSDATLGNLGDADRESYEAITRSFSHWDDIDIHFKKDVFRSTGHGFSG